MSAGEGGPIKGRGYMNATTSDTMRSKMTVSLHKKNEKKGQFWRFDTDERHAVNKFDGVSALCDVSACPSRYIPDSIVYPILV